jgi:hypothetical protein
MLPLDPQRARVLLEEISIPSVPPRTCKDVLSPDLSAYYKDCGESDVSDWPGPRLEPAFEPWALLGRQLHRYASSVG